MELKEDVRVIESTVVKIILGTADGDRACCLVGDGDALYVGTLEGGKVGLSVGMENSLGIFTIFLHLQIHTMGFIRLPNDCNSSTPTI